MNIELENKLIKDFPELFEQYSWSITESCMAFGCEHSDGWYDLLRIKCLKNLN